MYDVAHFSDKCLHLLALEQYEEALVLEIDLPCAID